MSRFLIQSNSILHVLSTIIFMNYTFYKIEITVKNFSVNPAIK
jgi:hypothetical protein